MKLFFLIIFSILISFRGFSQSGSGESASSTSFEKHELRFVDHYAFKAHAAKTQLSKSMVLSKIATPLPSFTLSVPARLPMFCAMEKRLSELCNVRIKIRLPEKEASNCQ